MKQVSGPDYLTLESAGRFLVLGFRREVGAAPVRCVVRGSGTVSVGEGMTSNFGSGDTDLKRLSPTCRLNGPTVGGRLRQLATPASGRKETWRESDQSRNPG